MSEHDLQPTLPATDHINGQQSQTPLPLPNSDTLEGAPLDSAGIEELFDDFLGCMSPQTVTPNPYNSARTGGLATISHGGFYTPAMADDTCTQEDDNLAYSSKQSVLGSSQDNTVPGSEPPVLCPPAAISPRQQLASRISSRRGLEKSGLPQAVLEPSRVADGKSLAMMVKIETQFGKVAKQLAAMQQKISMLEKSTKKTQESLQPIDKKCSLVVGAFPLIYIHA
jgi:hypothetical protein